MTLQNGCIKMIIESVMPWYENLDCFHTNINYTFTKNYFKGFVDRLPGTFKIKSDFSLCSPFYYHHLCSKVSWLHLCSLSLMMAISDVTGHVTLNPCIWLADGVNTCLLLVEESQHELGSDSLAHLHNKSINLFKKGSV